MLRNKARYFIEAAIHILFWLTVYYALNSLQASSFNIMVINHGKVAQGVSGRLLFPFAGLVLAVLIVLFYGYIFWLFKNLVRHKRNMAGIVAAAGWFVLLFAVNFFLIRAQIGPTNDIEHTRASLQKNPPKVTLSIDTTSSVGSNQQLSDSIFKRPDLNPPLPPPMKEFSKEDWWGMQTVMAVIFLAVLGIAIAYFFIKEWIRNDLARSQAEAQQYNTEIRFLRSQVNPHFLFNTLNNLFSMAQKRGDDDVANGISKLSGMMRYMIYESNTDSVPLQKEIEYLQDCIALNKLRYAGNEVTVNFTCPQQAVSAGVQVAPMLFIPFVENAFKYGVTIGRQSNIAISIRVSQKTLIFTCVNANYSSVKKMVEEQAGIGLENVKRRLQLVYPGSHQLQAGPAMEKYLVKLEINLA
jgi:phosphate/sulfate permease